MPDVIALPVGSPHSAQTDPRLELEELETVERWLERRLDYNVHGTPAFEDIELSRRIFSVAPGHKGRLKRLEKERAAFAQAYLDPLRELLYDVRQRIDELRKIIAAEAECTAA